MKPRSSARSTLKEVAKAAGVSTTTAGYVLRNKAGAVGISQATCDRILDSAKLLGYRPNVLARSLITGRAQAVLVAVLDPSNWSVVLNECIRGALESFTAASYSMVLCTIETMADVSRYSEIVSSGRVDAVLLLGAGCHYADAIFKSVCEIADNSALPLVPFGDAFLPTDSECLVTWDNKTGAEQAVRHLIEHGHSRIAFLGVAGARWSVDREIGYRAALETANIPIDPELILYVDQPSHNLAHETVRRACENLSFTAMFVVSDKMAVAAIRAIHRAGRKVPEDCAIVGFDDIEELAQLSDPQLTTICIPSWVAGRKVAESVMAAIEGRPITRVLLPVELVIRESCGCDLA